MRERGGEITPKTLLQEITGEGMNAVPVMLACLVSYFVSKALTTDLFSMIIKRRQLPFIIGLRETQEVEREKWRAEIAGRPTFE